MPMKTRNFFLGVCAAFLLAACAPDSAEPSAALHEETSLQQPFAVTLPEGFSLAAEEPSRDVVLYAADERAFMRIEFYPLQDGAADYLYQNSMEILQAALPQGEIRRPAEFPAKIPHAQNAAAWIARHNGNAVEVLVFRLPEYHVRLTIFSPQEHLPLWHNIAASLRVYPSAAQ